jgi:hypothetical protein
VANADIERGADRDRPVNQDEGEKREFYKVILYPVADSDGKRTGPICAKEFPRTEAERNQC